MICRALFTLTLHALCSVCIACCRHTQSCGLCHELEKFYRVAIDGGTKDEL